MMPLIAEAIEAIQPTAFDQQTKVHTATVAHLTDALIADLAQFNDQQQRYVVGLKDGITQFLTIYRAQENHLKYPTIGAYDCTLDLSKLVKYLSACSGCLWAAHKSPLPTPTQRKVAEKIYQTTDPLFNALRDWRKNSTSLLETSYQHIEQHINELVQLGYTFEDEQMRLIIQTLQADFKKLSELYAIDKRSREELDENDVDASIANSQRRIKLYTLSVAIQRVKLTPYEEKTVTKLVRAARVFEHVWCDVMNIHSFTVGVIPVEMPVLNADYD